MEPDTKAPSTDSSTTHAGNAKQRLSAMEISFDDAAMPGPCRLRRLKGAGHGFGHGLSRAFGCDQGGLGGEAGGDAQRQIAPAELWRQGGEAAHQTAAGTRTAGAWHVFQRML